MSATGVRAGRLVEVVTPSDEWRGLYDQLEVWRSNDGSAGPFELLHASTWQPAVLPGAADLSPGAPGRMLPLKDRYLDILVNETMPVRVVFTGPDLAITLLTASMQVDAQSMGLFSSRTIVSGLFIASTQMGLAASLRVTAGDAAALLGLPVGVLVHGYDVRIPLVTADVYSFADYDALEGVLYKSRYVSSSTGLVSDFSVPAIPRPLGALARSSMVKCFVQLVDIAGLPERNLEVLIEGSFQGARIQGKTFSGQRLSMRTDRRGYAEVMLARGVNVRVGVAGTDIARSVLIPMDPNVTSIDLLDPAYGTENDALTVQVPNLSYAVRRGI